MKFNTKFNTKYSDKEIYHNKTRALRCYCCNKILISSSISDLCPNCMHKSSEVAVYGISYDEMFEMLFDESTDLDIDEYEYLQSVAGSDT